MKTKRTFLSSLAAALLVFGLSTSAQAITFDLTEPDPFSLAVSFVVDDTTNAYSLTATGWSTDGQELVIRSSLGMGVVSYLLDDPEVDGFGPDETLRLDLGLDELVLTSATFTSVGSDDDFRLYVNGILQIPSADIPNNGIYVFNPALLGSVFAFTVAGSNDDYKLSSVTFSEVPEPGTLALLGMGLAGFAVRRKRSAA